MPYSYRHKASQPFPEKLRSGLAGGIALGILGWLVAQLPHGPQPPLLIGSIAASAVLLFAVPHSPMAQPWNLVVGHGLSAVAGWCCGLTIADPVLAGAVAVGLAIFLMHLLDSLHPPGAATALTLVLGGSQYHHSGLAWTAMLVAANVIGSLLLALFINNLLPGRRYPASPTPPPPSSPEFDGEDMRWALSRMDSAIDVSENDLLELYRLARHRATERALQCR